jgi:hypothetical protein
VPAEACPTRFSFVLGKGRRHMHMLLHLIPFELVVLLAVLVDNAAKRQKEFSIAVSAREVLNGSSALEKQGRVLVAKI